MNRALENLSQAVLYDPHVDERAYGSLHRNLFMSDVQFPTQGNEREKRQKWREKGTYVCHPGLFVLVPTTTLIEIVSEATLTFLDRELPRTELGKKGQKVM